MLHFVLTQRLILPLGYFNNPEATAQTITEDNWLHSGDLGYYDDELNFFVIDRLKELIKYKAFQVFWTQTNLNSLFFSVLNCVFLVEPHVNISFLIKCDVPLEKEYKSLYKLQKRGIFLHDYC